MEAVADDLQFLILFSIVFSPDGQKRKKSLRRKLDSLAKEKSKDKGTASFFKAPTETFSSRHRAGFYLTVVDRDHCDAHKENSKFDLK